MKYAQSTSVRQLIQKIENHPDRHALQKDLQQNQSLNPFSPESKQMIHEVGNIELRELLETEPKTQCKVCLSYWNIGILFCTCGHFLHKERGANQQFINYTMDLLSVPEYVARVMGSPRQAYNRRRRTCEGPEPACVRAPFRNGGGTRRRGKDELTSCRGTV